MTKLKKKLKRTFFIFCEGETESAYFSVLKQKKDYNVVIKTKVKWQIPTKAVDIKRFQKKIIRETKYTERLIENTNSHIYILVDSDIYSNQQIKEIKRLLDNGHTNVLFSNQDIELWLLLHFSLYKMSDWNYIKEIKKYEANYKKWYLSLDFFESIIDTRLDNAVSNAKRLLQFHTTNGRIDIFDQNPYSEVYKIIEELKK